MSDMSVTGMKPMSIFGDMVTVSATVGGVVGTIVGGTAATAIGVMSPRVSHAVLIGVIGGLIGGAGGAACGLASGSLSTAGVSLLKPETEDEFKRSASIGAAVGTAVLGASAGIVTGKRGITLAGRVDAAIKGLVVGGIAGYGVGYSAASVTLERNK